MFKKGQKVVQIITVFDSKTASLQQVDKVGRGPNGEVSLVDSSLRFSKSGYEIGPAFSGCCSEIVVLEE